MDAPPHVAHAMNRLVLGTRGSELALVQARDAAARLRAVHPGLDVCERIIRTTGDRRLDVRLSAPGPLDKGLFTKELEEALLAGTVDVAVHSLKDLPTVQPPGLVVGAILERADHSDALASKHAGGLHGLPGGATVATSSLRRKNQLLALRPDLEVVEIRGNVPTRLRKVVETPGIAALVVASAALVRLGADVVPGGLDVSVIAEMLPAPGQGAVAIECRVDDAPTLGRLAAIHHEPTARCVSAERDLLRSLGGGCHMPLGALATIGDGRLRLVAGLFEPDGVRWISR
jgi:hydroxymethylbilane synthase